MTQRLLPLLALFAFALAATLPACPAMAQRVDQLPALKSSRPRKAAKPSSPVPSPDAQPARPHRAEPMEERIAAVVNEGVVSISDVRARLNLSMLSSGLPDTPEVKQHLFPQVLRSLIDEQLQLQEGKRLGITVSKEEIDQALRQLSAQNNIPGGDIVAFLKAQGVPSSTLTDQVRSVLTWNKVAQRELRPRIDIGDDEVDAVVERLRANSGKQEYLVSEIYLALDNPKDEDEVKRFAENLVAQIKNGANFGAVARQFSQGTGAATGGDIGWIQTGQLSTEVDKTMQNMQQGEVAGPVRSASGYHILGVRDKRTVALGDPKMASLKLQQAFRPFTPDIDKAKLLQEASQLRQTVTDCKDIPARLAKTFPDWRWQDLGDVKMASAPPWLIDKVRDIPVGHSSDAMATDKGALIVFVCGRDMKEDIDRNAIMNSIGSERMELLARRLMRDLRRNAHIDVRLSLTQ